jgi:hypothetical protein
MKSFTYHEKEILPVFREKLSRTKKTSEVKPVFSRTVIDILNKVAPDIPPVEEKDIALDPDNRTFRFKKMSGDLEQIMKESDLNAIIQRIADTAMHRYHHLNKDKERKNYINLHS